MNRPPNNAAYRMGDGVVFIFYCEVPLKPFEPGFFYYEELSVGTDDYNIARQDSVELSMRVRILQNRDITNLNIAKIGERHYEIWRTRNLINKNGVPVTDLFLKASLEVFEVRNE